MGATKLTSSQISDVIKYQFAYSEYWLVLYLVLYLQILVAAFLFVPTMCWFQVMPVLFCCSASLAAGEDFSQTTDVSPVDKQSNQTTRYIPSPTTPPRYTPRRYFTKFHHPGYPSTKKPILFKNPDNNASTGKPQPDTCNTSYDAVAMLRRELFIFKDAYFWRLGDRGLFEGYPVKMQRFWRDLPKNLTHVDAVYERPDTKIVFFIGQRYYVHWGNFMERGYPKPLTDLGLPEWLEKIDAALVWGHNGKTYFFSGDMYWKFDEDLLKVELDYPRNISMWTGVDTDIDAAFQWKDGKTYFFKGKEFWKFNDLQMRVEHALPIFSAQFWMNCYQPIVNVDNN